uniref:Zinc finger protein 706 n=1 Tax=Paramormyrops kingsleyae TaxID=1676925 RepID=A0A3B3TA63_9TELE
MVNIYARAVFLKPVPRQSTFLLPPNSQSKNEENIRRNERTSIAMARGHQKIQSQQKNAKKQAEAKKSKGHDQKAAAKVALVYTCAVCRTQMPDPKTFKQHFESKHPKSPLPPELVGVEA